MTVVERALNLLLGVTEILFSINKLNTDMSLTKHEKENLSCINSQVMTI